MPGLSNHGKFTMSEGAPQGLRFTKMHGAGNDFVVLDLRDDAALAQRLVQGDADLCRALGDRHTGIGCDQVLTIEAPRSAAAIASYRIWNGDGSQAQQCGNGARCVAAWLCRDSDRQGDGFELDSPSGTHAVRRMDDGQFEIAMGAADFDPHTIPLHGVAGEADEYTVQLATAHGQQLTTLRFGAASMGNPHALVEVADIARAPLDSIGPALQRHAMFPDSVNVGFAQVLARDRIALRVYERGAGETLACGSGACAAVAILAHRGRVDGADGVEVLLPGGRLRIVCEPGAGLVRMAGPAAFVFEGVWMQ